MKNKDYISVIIWGFAIAEISFQGCIFLNNGKLIGYAFLFMWRVDFAKDDPTLGTQYLYNLKLVLFWKKVLLKLL